MNDENTALRVLVHVQREELDEVHGLMERMLAWWDALPLTERLHDHDTLLEIVRAHRKALLLTEPQEKTDAPG